MQKTVSYEIAKELKEAGWDKKTEKSWFAFYPDGMDEDPNEELNNSEWDIKDWYEKTPAPDFMELWEELPKDLEPKEEIGNHLTLYEGMACYEQSGYYDQPTYSHKTTAGNPIDALALLWIKLKKKGLI